MTVSGRESRVGSTSSDLPFTTADVGEGLAVDEGVLDGRGRLLQSDYPAVVGGEQDSKCADAPVGVGEEFIAGGTEAVTELGSHTLCLRGVHLEE